MSIKKNRRLSLLVGAAIVACIAPVFAVGSLSIELNKLEPQDGACRAYLVFENRTGASFSNLTLDLVMFDSQGVIAKRLAVNAAPLPAEKTSVKLFDIEGLACANIGRILINDALDCEDEGGEISKCVTRIEPSSRSQAPLIK